MALSGGVRSEKALAYTLIVAVLSVAALSAVSLHAMNLLSVSQAGAGGERTAENVEQAVRLPVRGVGLVRVRPDSLTVSLGVEARGETPVEASSKSSEAMQRVISTLLTNGVEEKKIRTTHLAVYPDWVCDNEGCRQKGFVAMNEVIVILEDELIASSPKIIGDALQAGATRLEGAWFGLKDETRQKLRDEALQLAFSDAYSKVAKILEHLKMRIKSIEQVNVIFPDEGGVPFPIYRSGEAAGSPLSGNIPVMPGESSYSVTVELTFLVEEVA